MNISTILIAGTVSLAALVVLPTLAGQQEFGLTQATEAISNELFNNGVADRLDISGLYRSPDGRHTLTTDGSVSLVPIAYDQVKKIAFGKKSMVRIVTTASGVYSTEGLYSPYIRYPGITLSPNPDAEPEHGVLVLAAGGNWIGVPLSGTSLVHQMSGSLGHFVQTSSGSCVVMTNAVHCR